MHCLKLTVFLLTAYPCLLSGLICRIGEEIIYSYSKAASTPRFEVCSDTETHCLRMESSGTQFMLPVNLTKTMCATRELCENPSCSELSRMIFHSPQDESDGVGSDIPALLFRLRTCKVSCCQNDHCNQMPTINVLRDPPQIQEEIHPIEALSESTTSVSSTEEYNIITSTEEYNINTLTEKYNDVTTHDIVRKLNVTKAGNFSTKHSPNNHTIIFSFILFLLFCLLQV